MRHIIAFLPILMLGCTSSEHNGFDHQSSEDAGSSFDKPNDFDASCVNCAVNDAGVGITSNDDAGLVLDPNCSQKTNKCHDGQGCQVNEDCISNLCRFDHVCTSEKSCVNYYGGLTCGEKEVGEANAVHESCCKSLPVPGFYDRVHKDKTVYLDKYEITAGRMRAFINYVSKEMGKPDLKSWVQKHPPTIWNNDWNKFLPSDYEGGTILVDKMLLGDPRHANILQSEAPPGVIVPPTSDQNINVGLNHQFNGAIFADTHGNNCGSYKDSYGFSTYYYKDDVLIANGEMARPNPTIWNGSTINAQDSLDTKSLNCVTNVMLHLLCSFDGGELASTEVIDFITNSPPDRPLTVSGCGTQYSNHNDLLSNVTTTSLFTGGLCADAYSGYVNLTFDAGDTLPVIGSFLNTHFYHYPDLNESTSDKSWQIASPGRMSNDIVRSGNDGWMDIAGNLTESVIEKNNNSFTGKFSMRGQGIGFGSARSDLNVTYMPNETILRVQRPEAKSGLVGGRCIYYK